MKQLKTGVVLACAGILSACGGGGDDQAAGPPLQPPPAQTPARGSLLAEPTTRLALSAQALQTQLASTSDGQALLSIAGTPKCGVRIHHFEYSTEGGAKESTNATGAIMAPDGTAPECSGARPVLLYAHGTTTDRNYNIADIAGNNSGAGEGRLIASMFAAQGFVVVAPNYAGYDQSKLGYHPYLHGQQQAGDMQDALSAARKAFTPLQINDSGKLLLSGYSQGGYVAMATHRALQAAGVKVTAAAPMSGPYALAAFGDAMFGGNVNLGATIFVPMMMTAYQKAYGNLYSTPADIYEAKYATGIESLLPSTVPTSTLYSQGKLPATQLFSSTAPAPGLESITPPTTPAAMAPLFALGFGNDHLIKNSVRLSYLQDAQLRPDGAVPSVTNGLPASAPSHPVRQALKANDLRNWTPQSPVLLCGGNGDPTVFYSINTTLMGTLWSAPSAMAPATGMVSVLDVDSSSSGAADPYAVVKAGFAQAKTAKAAAGVSAVTQAYHGELVPPFCSVAARGFFQQVLAQGG